VVETNGAERPNATSIATRVFMEEILRGSPETGHRNS